MIQINTDARGRSEWYSYFIMNKPKLSMKIAKSPGFFVKSESAAITDSSTTNSFVANSYSPIFTTAFDFPVTATMQSLFTHDVTQAIKSF